MKIRVFIFGHYGEFNVGDDAMIYVLLHELNIKYPYADFSILSPREIYIPSDMLGKVRFVKPHVMDVFSEIRKSSIFIMGGGTQIYDYGKRLERLTTLFKILIIIFWAKIFCEKIYFFNIGLEPFSTNLRKILANCICRLSDFITVRDNKSYEIITDMKIKRVKISFDLAVLLDYKIVKKSNDFNVLGVSILPFFELYHGKKEKDLLFIDEMAYILTNWVKSNNKNRISLFVFNGSLRTNDFEITKLLKDKISSSRVEIVSYDSNPQKILNSVNSCDFFIGMKYHSCLFAYMTNTPLLVISYFHKCKYLAEEIKLPDKSILTMEDVLNGSLKYYLNDFINNSEDYLAQLSLNEAKKRAKLFCTILDYGV